MDQADLLKHLSPLDMAGLLELATAALGCKGKEDFPFLFDKLKDLISCDSSYWCPWKWSGELEFASVNIDFPEEWLEWYFANELHLIDKVTTEFARTYELQNWRDVERKLHDKTTRMINGESRVFGLRDGFSGGICDSARHYGVLVTVAGERVENNSRTRTILNYILPHLGECLRRLHDFPHRCSHPKLTRMEYEVLLWLKEGKTSWEISKILARSERTVNFHVKNIVTKLGATNRMHAVAIAIQEQIMPLD